MKAMLLFIKVTVGLLLDCAKRALGARPSALGMSDTFMEPRRITPGASPPMHHLRCITPVVSPLLHQPPVHHLLPPPAHLGGLHTQLYSHTLTQLHSHTLLHPQDSVALIIALNLEDGHRPNLLVPLSNHLILKDNRPNLLGLNYYSVESTRRR